METNKRVFLHGREYWTISSVDATAMGFYGKMMRIPWTKNISNIEAIEQKKRTFYVASEKVEISRNNEKRGLGNYDTHKMYWKLLGQMNAVYNVLKVLL